MTPGHQRTILIVWKTAALVAAILMFFAASCGKKGPPTPPKTLSPAPAVDLALVQQDGGLLLTWHLPEGWQADYARPAGFIVERALTPKELDCQGCPVRFEQAAQVDFQEGRSRTDVWRFTDALRPDMVQRYRVISLGEKGAKSRPSETMTFDPESDSGS
ncbi:MAG: hypothetical protein R6U41_11545 [Desulfosalsimonas sp.]|uniref:hypothetical protein n=1 Tax=Desulfosalsimonas sp. TaxID=3073848 RepID=UPI003970DAFB